MRRKRVDCLWDASERVSGIARGLPRIVRSVRTTRWIIDFFARASDAAQDGRDALKARLGIRTPHVVLYCGNLLDLKGVGDLLEGFSRFARDRDDVSLVLVGSGAGEAKYRAAAEQAGLGDRVVFAGFVAAAGGTTVLCAGRPARAGFAA